MVMILNNSEIGRLSEKVDERIFRRIDESRNFFYKLDENVFFLTFHWLDHQKVTIYSCCDELIVITDSKEVADFAGNIDVPDNGMLQLYEFFMELTSEDIEKLENLENSISALEDRLLVDNKPDKEGISAIVTVRKKILHMKRYYEQMEFMTDEMAAADSSFAFIDKKFDRLLEFVIHLQEYEEQVREAYQSQIDIEQNNIMKLFTVITTIFLPLTLLTGWYGMNLVMPEYKWAYGYPVVIAVAVAVVVILMIIFKKRKWF